MEKTRAMLIDAELPKSLWAEAIVTANYLRNRSPVSGLSRSPWEVFFGVVPDVSNLRLFGCRAYVFVPKQKRDKLDPRSVPGVFVGYDQNSKAYRVLVKGDIVVSRDVMFDEQRTGMVKATATDDSETVTIELEAPDDVANPVVQPVVGVGGDGIAVDVPEAEPVLDVVDEAPEHDVVVDQPGVENVDQPVPVGEQQQPGGEQERRYPLRNRRKPGDWFKRLVPMLLRSVVMSLKV